MTRTDLLTELAQLEQLLASRVTVVRVILDAKGEVIGRIPRGSIRMPANWQPPTLEQQIEKAKGRR